METLEALIDRVDPAWPLIERWLSAALSEVVLLEREEASSARTLVHLQASTHTVLGALAWECGGLVIDSRVRVLGGGTAEVKASLRTWNGLPQDPMPLARGLVRVGFDAFGGVFALDGGAFGEGDGAVYYFAPDTLSWEPLGMGHSAWLHWLLTEPAKVASFYELFTWKGWQQDLARLTFDQALFLSPPPWSPEHTHDATVSGKAAPAVEVISSLLEAARRKN
jgi:hypothetical protein